MNKKLPDGWIWAKMLDILDYEGGSQPPKKDFVYEPRKGYVRLLQIRDFGKKPFPTYVPDSKRLKKATRDDLLLARYGGSSGSDSLGRVCTGLDGAYNVALTKLIFDPQLLEKEYVRYLFLGPWFKGKVSQNSRSCQTGFNRDDVKDILFPLAPFIEQQKIVKRLDGIFSRIEESQKHLSKIPIILKRFRQSVLASACSGRLTADWRFANPTVSAQQLIASLKTVEPKNYMDVFEQSSAGEIPSTWGWVRLGKLGAFLGGGTPSKNNSAYWNGKIPWVSPKDMKRDRINDSQDHITSKALEKSTTKLIPKGSILFVVRGMILNHTLPTAVTDVEITLNQDMKALVPEIKEMSEYLFWVSKHISTAMLFEVKEATHGTRRIETPFLKNWAIPIPPIDEQREIVKRIQNLMALSNEIEARYVKAKIQIDKLSQSILGKAFRGELVTLPLREVSEEKMPRQTKPNLKTEALTNQSADVIYFRSIVPRREERYMNCVPSLDFEIAAGAFGEDQRPDFNEWVQINTSRPLKKGMFVAKVVGHSMEPLIPDGAHCLFQFKAPQLRNDMIAVFQLHDSEDPESGGHYTVKRLRVYRQNTDEGVVRKAKLMPENPAFQPITVDEDNVKFVAEFLEVLQPLAKAGNTSGRASHV